MLTRTSIGDTQTEFRVSLCGLGLRFVPFPGLSSSGDQVLGARTLPGGPCVLITSLVPVAWFPGYAGRAPTQVCRVSPLGSWSQAVTLLVDVNRTDSQEDVVSSWELAHSLVVDASLEQRLPLVFLLWLSLTCFSASGGGMGQCTAG